MWRTSLAYAVAWALSCGCGGSTGDSVSDPTLTHDDPVHVTSEQHRAVDVRATAPIRVGKNTVVVRFPEGGVELASAWALMPAHGHGSPKAVIEHDGDAFVVKDLVFFMSGRWELRLAMRLDTQQDEAVVAVDVP